MGLPDSLAGGSLPMLKVKSRCLCSCGGEHHCLQFVSMSMEDLLCRKKILRLFVLIVIAVGLYEWKTDILDIILIV